LDVLANGALLNGGVSIMNDDFTPLTESGHYLGWLGEDPAQVVRDSIEGILREQVPTAKLAWIHLQGEPEFLTGGHKVSGEPTKLILTRAALAVAFVLEVHSDGRVDNLEGVFSWVAAGLDAQRRDRSYFDLTAKLEWASEMLEERIYELDLSDS
jgi:hypothetical protein